MRTAAVALILAAGAALAADSLLERVKAKVVENTRRVPRYTCVETINRGEYRPRFQAERASCAGLIQARDKLDSPGYQTWRDRLRLDVAVLDGKETFSWAGADKFETTDLQKLVPTGSAGSGDFASFLATIFGKPGVKIAAAGDDLFQFEVPLNISGYIYRSRANVARVTDYYGTILVDPATADMKQLTVDADDFPPDEPVCRVRDVMDYQRVKIGDGDFVMPDKAVMSVLFSSGNESQNETTYSNCREYTGESTIRFDDDAAQNTANQHAASHKVPARVKVQLALKDLIDSETAAAGDGVTAVVLRNAKGIKAGEQFPGRIVRIEQFLFPEPRWVVAFQFDGLSLSRPIFTFDERGALKLDQRFHFDAETR